MIRIPSETRIPVPEMSGRNLNDPIPEMSICIQIREEVIITMGYQTKVQLIKRKESEQWYVNFPAQVAQAMEFEKGETVEWFVEDKETLALKRHCVPGPILKKKRPE
jgi:hypothetical protein